MIIITFSDAFIVVKNNMSRASAQKRTSSKYHINIGNWVEFDFSTLIGRPGEPG